MLKSRPPIARVLTFVVSLAALPVAVQAQTGSPGERFVVASGPGGGAWVAGSLTRQRETGLVDPADILVVRSDAAGRAPERQLWLGGSGCDVVRAIAVDGGGFVWVAGTTDSPDFPAGSDSRSAGASRPRPFVLKLSSDGGSVLASWVGSEAGEANALAVVGRGVVVAGSAVTVLGADAVPAATRTLSGAVATDVIVTADGGIVVAGASPSIGGFVRCYQRELDGVVWSTGLDAFGIPAVAHLGRAADGAILALASRGSLWRLDRITGIASAATVADVAGDRRLGLLGGRATPARLAGASVDDAAAAGDGGLWIVAETRARVPDDALLLAGAEPGAQVFLMRDPAAPAAVCPGTINFDNSAGTGLWQTAANWDTNTLPGPTDDVCIDGFAVTLSSGAQVARTVSAGASGTLSISVGTLTISQDAVFNALTISSGSIAGAAAVTINGAFTWSGGALAGSGTVTAAGGTTISNNPTLDGRRLINPAGQTIAYPTAGATLSLSNGAVIQNDGTFDSQANNTIQFSGSGSGATFENSGTFKKSAGTGTSQFTVDVTNTGAITVQTGTLRWIRNMTSTGSVSAASGTTLQFSSGSQSMNPAPVVPAGATLVADGATVTIGTGYNPLGATQLAASSLTLNGSPNVLASLAHSGGTLTGPSNITVTGSWTWSGGALAQTVAGTTATAASGMALSNNPTLDGRRLINPAGQTIAYTTAGATFTLSNGAVIQNDGTFDSQANNTIQFSGSGSGATIENSGTLTKSAGTGTTQFTVDVTNTGAITVQTGTLRWARNMTSTGSVSAASGATLQFSSGSQSMSQAPVVPAGATLLADGGTVTIGTGYNPLGATQLAASSLTLNGSPNVLASLAQSGGTLTGPSNITVTGSWTWSGGALAQTAVGTTATASAGMALSNNPTLDGRRLINLAGQTISYPTANATFTLSNGAVIQNDGTFDSQANNTIQFSGSGSAAAFENSGTFKKSAGTGTSQFTVDVTSTGAITVQTGTLRWARNMTSTGTVSAASGTTLQFSSGSQSMSQAPVVPAGATLVADGGTVTIGAGYNPLGATQLAASSLTLNGSPNVLASLAHSGGTLTGPSNITVTGSWTWLGGALAQTAIGTTATAASGMALSNNPTLDGRRLINPAGQTIAYPTAGATFTLSNGAVIQNDGTFDSQANNTIQFSGSGSAAAFENSGTFKKSAGTGTSQFTVDVTSTGAITVQTGTLRWARNMTSTGTVSAASGTTLQFSSGSQSMDPAPVVPAGATLVADGGTVTIGTGYNPLGATQLAASSLTLNGSPNVLASLAHSGGTLTGPSNITVTGSWTWSGGALAQTAAGTTATAASGMALSNNPTLDGRRLINPAGQTIAYPTAGATFSLSNGAVVQNDGTFDLQADDTIQFTGSGSTATIESSGTFKKSGGTGASVLSIAITSGGTIAAETGTIQFNRDVTSTGTVSASSGARLLFVAGTGTFDPAPSIPAGATLRIDGGSWSFGGGYGPTGSTLLNSGSLALNGASNVLDSLNHTNGTLTGSGNFAVSGAWAWSGGTLAQSATGTTATISGTLAQSGSVTLDGRKLVNPSGKTLSITSAGTMSFSNGATLENSGTVDFLADGGLSWTGSGAPGGLVNLGLVKKSGGVAVSAVGVDVQNQGTIDAASGTLRFQRPFTQTAGAARLVGGTIDSTSSFTLQGGALVGSGTITGAIANTGGALSPGLSPGTITIGGSYTQSGAGSYAVELGGLTAGTQHDRVVVAPAPAAANLGGVLDVTLINGFTPSLGDAFTIMTYGSHTGSFATVNAPDLGPALTWTVAYNATSAVLTVAPVANPDLAVTVGDAPDPVPVGQSLTYTITVANSGTATATAATLTDPLPAAAAFQSVSTTAGTCNQAAGTVTCAFGDLAVAASATVTIVVTPGTSAVPSITNTATAATTATDPFPANDAATATTTVLPASDLSIGVTDSPDPVASSGALSYTVNVANAGPSGATSITMTNTLPAGTIFQSASGTGWTCGQAAGVVTCTRPTLAVGAAPAITISVTVPANGGSITDTASVTAAEFDPTTPNTATAGTTVTATADLSITNGDAPDPVNAGASLTYTLGVSNAGPSAASSVSVVDTLPAGVVFQSASGTGWTCGQAAGVVTCTRPSLAVGAAPAITIIVTAPGAGGSITNNATVTAAETDPTTPNTASATTTVTPVADLSLTKTDGPDPVGVGATLTYTITVTNAGPSAATSLSVTDPLPAGVTFANASGTGWTCGQAAGTVTCTRPSLAVGPAPAITITVTAPSNGGSITNTATVTAAEADPNAANNSGSATTSVTSSADLALSLTDAPDPVNAGATLTYTVTVTNGGPSASGPVTVTDVLPAGTTFVSATGTGWSCALAAGTVTCTRATLPAGAAPLIAIVVTAPANGGSVTDTSSVSSGTADPVSTNNTATTTTTVTPVNDLSIVKTASASNVPATGSFTYTLAVSNAGPSTAASVTVTDPLPAGVTFVSAAGTGWTCSQASGTVTCTRSNLAVGAAPAITITVNAPAAGGTLDNTATVAATGDPTAGNNTSTASVTIDPASDLRVTKTTNVTSVVDGGTLTYTLAVQNLGPSPATTVVITDGLSSAFTFVSATGSGWTCTEVSGTVSCSRPTLAVGTAPSITLTVDVFTDGKTGVACNQASVEGDQADPVSTNDTSQACVNVVIAGACNNLNDLLGQVEDADMASNKRIVLESSLSTTINAANSGATTAVAGRLGTFIKQVQAAKSQGAIDASDADSLVACAQNLRQQYLPGGTQGAKAAPAAAAPAKAAAKPGPATKPATKR